MRILLALLLCVASVSALAQTAEERARKSDQIMIRVRELDLLNHILPLVMTKEQLRQILPVVERARQRVTDAQKKEFALLLTFEKKLDEAHKNAIEKSQIPGRELLIELSKGLQALEIVRMGIADQNTEDVLKAFKAIMNAGQLKSAANSLNPASLDPTIKVDEMTEEAKLRFYIREIFLDPLAYDILVRLSR
ncbi:MAG TPA: hypothetical protein VM328_03655 [Fimbriimonadaceae bacterium]|nr:hypothetical protein [Fimbriimonadaceae bacterium]